MLANIGILEEWTKAKFYYPAIAPIIYLDFLFSKSNLISHELQFKFKLKYAN